MSALLLEELHADQRAAAGRVDQLASQAPARQVESWVVVMRRCAARDRMRRLGIVPLASRPAR